MREATWARAICALTCALLVACQSTDTSTSTVDAAGAGQFGICGNGEREDGEECDGVVDRETCESATLGARPQGTLRCDATCRLDYSDCKAAEGGASRTPTADAATEPLDCDCTEASPCPLQCGPQNRDCATLDTSLAVHTMCDPLVPTYKRVRWGCDYVALTTNTVGSASTRWYDRTTGQLVGQSWGDDVGAMGCSGRAPDPECSSRMQACYACDPGCMPGGTDASGTGGDADTPPEAGGEGGAP